MYAMLVTYLGILVKKKSTSMFKFFNLLFIYIYFFHNITDNKKLWQLWLTF